MKKWGYLFLVTVMAVAAGVAMPFTRTDVAQLVPVEALVVSMEDGRLVLDGGDCKGCGQTWEAAWQDLKESAEGIVFLSTAEYVILTGAAVELMQDVVWNKELRPAAELYAALGVTPDPKDAAAYLSVHGAGVPLYQARTALLENRNIHLPILVETEGGIRLYGTGDW